jgi:hypothetical protein
MKPAIRKTGPRVFVFENRAAAAGRSNLVDA